MSGGRIGNVLKKLFVIMLVTVLTTGCVVTTGCDNSNDNNVSDASTEVEVSVVKPEKIRVVVDPEMVPNKIDIKKFEEYLEKLLASYGDEGDIDVEIMQWPVYMYAYGSPGGDDRAVLDVMLLPVESYKLYAYSGMLWNMTSAWEETKLKIADRLTENSDTVISNFYVRGNDGKKGVYGISPSRGGGCCTYVKADWLKNAGIDRSSIEGRVLRFDEYYDMLKKMQKVSKSGYVLSPPGYISQTPPYTQYLPEFYQNAVYDFYKDESGTYVDGFAQQEMIDALTRIQTAVKERVININADEKSEDASCDYFCTPDTQMETGVITYWAGRWAQTFSTSLQGKKRTDGTTMSGELVAIKPIAELGKYIEHTPYVWAITDECENPEGVYKYFIEPMLDGGDIQMAWQYGVKGVDWDDTTQDYVINYVDPLLAIAPIKNDPGISKVSAMVKESTEIFSNNAKAYEKVPMTEWYGTNMADINKKRREIISHVAQDPSYSAKQGIQDYKAAVGTLVDNVLESLNKLEE